MLERDEYRAIRARTEQYLEERLPDNARRDIGDDITALLDELKRQRADLERFRSYVEEAEDVIYEVDLQGNIIYMSPAVKGLLGYEPGELVGHDLDAQVHPEDLRKVEAGLQRMVEQRSSVEVEVRVYHKSGEERIHYARGTPLFDEEENPVSALVISRDVTEKRRLAEEMRRSEERHRSYVENAPHGVFITDAEGRYIEVNPEAARMTGYRPDELTSMYISELIHPDGRQQSIEDFEKLRREGSIRAEEPFLHKSGEKRWWRVTAVRLAEERYLGYTEDITEERAAKLELERSHSQILTVFNGLEAGVFVVSHEDDTIIFANRYLEELMETELVGHTCDHHFSEGGPDSCELCPMQTGDEFDPDKSVSAEYRLPGTEMWFLMNVRGIRWIDGTWARLHVLTDITAIKERESLREDISRITRHDLKTPLNGILGAAQLLQQGELEASQRRFVEMIEDSGTRMLRIINQSLGLYKMEEGSYSPRWERISCRNLISTVTAEISRAPESRGKELIFRGCSCGSEPCEDFMLEGEYDLCYTIFTNLLKNAMEAGEAGETVELEVRELSGGMARISVWNPRPIPEEIRSRFGQKYSTAGKRHGTGLGVYSARMMTEVQGGRFWWKSSEQEGTTVYVELPTAE